MFARSFALTMLLAAAAILTITMGTRQSMGLFVSPLNTATGLGIMATLGMQAVMNLMVVTGLAPTKGIALPLLSSGGTGWILTAGSLGLLVAMDRCLEEASPSGEPVIQTTAMELKPSSTPLAAARAMTASA